MYYNGRGVIQDYKQAVKWYTLAAEQSDAFGQLNIGVTHNSGHGVLQDNVYAHMWFNIAASNNRDNVANKMTKEQIAESQKLARECSAKD